MPEKEKPPATLVDIYFYFLELFAINTELLVWYNKAVNADRYFVFIKGGT